MFAGYQMSNWTGYFALCGDEARAWLRTAFNLPIETLLEPAAMEQAVAQLSDDDYSRLELFRAGSSVLANPDNRFLSDALADWPDIDVPELISGLDRVVWVRRYHPLVHDRALTLVEYDRRFQNDQFWNGFPMSDPFDVEDLYEKLERAKPALATCFQSRGRPVPKIRLGHFRRASDRSDSKAIVCTIEVKGDREQVRAFGDTETEFLSYNPEWGATLVLDCKAQVIDIISSQGGKTLRTGLVTQLAPFLGTSFNPERALKARYVDLSPLQRRCRIPIEPGDGLVAEPLFVSATLARGSLGLLRLDARDSSRADAWAEYGAWTGTSGHSFEGAKVIGAGITFSFNPAEGKTMPQTRFLKLSVPSGLTQRQWPSRHRDVAERILTRFGILNPPGQS